MSPVVTDAARGAIAWTAKRRISNGSSIQDRQRRFGFRDGVGVRFPRTRQRVEIQKLGEDAFRLGAILSAEVLELLGGELAEQFPQACSFPFFVRDVRERDILGIPPPFHAAVSFGIGTTFASLAG